MAFNDKFIHVKATRKALSVEIIFEFQDQIHFSFDGRFNAVRDIELGNVDEGRCDEVNHNTSSGIIAVIASRAEVCNKS